MSKILEEKKWSLLIVLLFFVWGGISYQWYTCGIKGLCKQSTINIQIGGDNGIEINKNN